MFCNVLSGSAALGRFYFAQTQLGLILSAGEEEHPAYRHFQQLYEVCTAYIMFDVYDNKNRLLTHASVRIDVKTGIRPRGDSTRQIGVF